MLGNRKVRSSNFGLGNCNPETPLWIVCLIFDSNNTAAAAAKSLQSCPTLWDPIDGSLPGSPIPGILQARTLEWVAISFSNAWEWKVKVKSLSRVRLLVTPWTAAYQAPPPMGFARQSTGGGSHCLLWRVFSSQPIKNSSKGKNLKELFLIMSLYTADSTERIACTSLTVCQELF